MISSKMIMWFEKSNTPLTVLKLMMKRIEEIEEEVQVEPRVRLSRYSTFLLFETHYNVVRHPVLSQF